MQAQADPHTSPCRSSSFFTKVGSIWDGSSIGISTVSNPHFLKVLKSGVLSLVKGEVNRKVLMPNLIMDIDERLVERQAVSKVFAAGKRLCLRGVNNHFETAPYLIRKNMALAFVVSRTGGPRTQRPGIQCRWLYNTLSATQSGVRSPDPRSPSGIGSDPGQSVSWRDRPKFFV